MKSIITTLLFAGTVSMGYSQNIKLPAPQKTGGKPLMEALNERHSSREFVAGKQMPMQTLSNLLWSAWGFNRANKRTAPSSRDKQEITLYAFLPNGTYKYDAAKNELIEVNKKDLRKMTGEQDFVGNASLNLVYVADLKKITGKDRESMIATVNANTGFIAQNVYLFCASANLNCVVRAMIDRAKLSKELGLRPDEMITLAQSVGYGKDAK